jgi:hypothetical protein
MRQDSLAPENESSSSSHFLTAEGGGATFSLTLEPETFTIKPAATEDFVFKS